MKRFFHLSDLHFGRIEALTIDPLLNFISDHQCDFVIISGDLTQRALKSQFELAKEFLKRIPVNYIVVPGNHDIPLYNLWARIWYPFKNYKNSISENLEPTYIQKDKAILCLNTVSFWTKEGVYDPQRIERLSLVYRSIPSNVLKILVSHHAVPASILEEWKLDFDLCLAGHTHIPNVCLQKISSNKSYLLVHAGTTTSTRTERGHKNSLNVIDFDNTQMSIESHEWDCIKSRFNQTNKRVFRKNLGLWIEHSFS